MPRSRHYLGAGLTLSDVFRQQAAIGRGDCLRLADRDSAEMEQGGGLEEAMKSQSDVFPPLMTALATVGEQTGMLPEVFTELEKYYVRQQQLRRLFLALTAWPAIQFLGRRLGAGRPDLHFRTNPAGIGAIRATLRPIGTWPVGATGGLLFLASIFGFFSFFGVVPLMDSIA